MANTRNSTRNSSKKRKYRREKTRGQAVLSVVSLRISDAEKERIDEIMGLGNIKHYSDVLRMAFQMVRVLKNDEHERADIFH